MPPIFDDPMFITVVDEEHSVDFSSMRIVEKGRYAPHRLAGKNVVLLAPYVMEAFPTDEALLMLT
ncbi:MAG: hypothetical protein ABFS56_31665 [Pseudomonadota bacterium]